MGGNFKFQVQDSFLEYFFFKIWRSKKQIALSEKKPPLGCPQLTQQNMGQDARFKQTSEKNADRLTSKNLNKTWKERCHYKALQKIRCSEETSLNFELEAI